jgi:hypothetical protein
MHEFGRVCGSGGVGVFVTSGRILVSSSLLGRADCHTFNLPPPLVFECGTGRTFVLLTVERAECGISLWTTSMPRSARNCSVSLSGIPSLSLSSATRFVSGMF